MLQTTKNLVLAEHWAPISSPTVWTQQTDGIQGPMTRSFLWRTGDRCWGNIIYILSGAGPIQPGRPSFWFDIQQLQGTYKKVRTFVCFVSCQLSSHPYYRWWSKDSIHSHPSKNTPQVACVDPNQKTDSESSSGSPLARFWSQNSWAWKVEAFSQLKINAFMFFILILEWLAWRLLACVDIWLDGDGWSSEDPSRSSIFILLFYS